MTRTSFEQIAARLAATQHGVVTRAQLRDAGVGAHVIEHRVQTGRIRRLHQGVYLVGPVVPPHAPEMAACLACGPRAVLSHRSAAVLLQVVKRMKPTAHVEVAIPNGFRQRPGIRVHRIGTLRPDEVTRLHGIPVTTAVRTLYDLAAVLRRRPLERAVAEAIARGLTNAAEVQAMIQRRAGRRGASRLAAVFDGGGPALTRSDAEEHFLRLVLRARIDPPEVNVFVAGHEVDFYWPAERLAAEVDGFAFHASPRAFARDRRRDADLAAAGLRVMRIPSQQITDEPEALLVRLGRALAVTSRGG
jgi:very-short-patch-repair endonuclease/predicted transcriptional regulator of viral defense system